MDEQLALTTSAMPATAIDGAVEVVAAIRQYLEARALADSLDPAESRPTDGLDIATDVALDAADRLVDVAQALIEHLVSLGPPEPTSPTIMDWFEQFWLAYPRKVGKPAAKKAFKSAMKRAGIEAIAEGLGRWVEYWEDRSEPEFVPHPSTWLNQDRWDDHPPAPSRSKPRSTHIGSILEGMRERATERARQREGNTR